LARLELSVVNASAAPADHAVVSYGARGAITGSDVGMLV